MRITVEFESLEEFQKHMAQKTTIELPYDGISVLPATLPQEKPHAEPVDIPLVSAAAAEPAPWLAPATEPEPDPAPAITEDFRVDVRKALATLNKMQAGNPAKALIAETGYKRLTDVPLELLPALMNKAKEAMDNA